jgi:hypothetical protein
MARAQTSTLANTAAALFDKYCLSEAPDFANLDREASAEKYQVVIDRSLPTGKDMQPVREKDWLVPTSSGRLHLNSVDAGDDAVHLVGCGVSVFDGDAAALESALTANPRLGKPVNRVANSRGTISTITWLARVGDAAPSEDAKVEMAARLPGPSGVTITLVYRMHRDR